MDNQPRISIRGASVCYNGRRGAPAQNSLTDFSDDIREGEFLVCVGPSGAGKSTLLRLIAGLVQPSRGTIKKSTSDPRVGFVFQENSVFPFKTVAENLSFSQEIAGVSKTERREVAAEWCGRLGLEPEAYLDRYPAELSGGEARRVALGMALAFKPEILLLDEPTSSLDFLTKRRIQNTIQELCFQEGITTVLCTHDLEEALFLGDRAILIEDGRKVASVSIPFKRPRTDSLRTTLEFGNLLERIVAEHFSESTQ